MEEKLFRTKDLAFTAYLKAHGEIIAKTSREDREVFFYFTDTPAIRAHQHAWGTSTAMVNAVAFARAMRQLKHVVHAV